MIQRPVMFERFAGRARELEELVSLRSRSALETQLACALVAGEAGFGKSRLLSEFRLRVERERGKYVVVRCFSGWSEPYAPILAALHQLRHGDRSGEAIDAAIDVLRTPDDDDVSSEERIRRRREPVAKAIAFEAKRRGHLTLVVEDAHWSDAESLAILRFLIERFSTIPALVVLTYRLSAIEGDFERARAIASLEREGAARIVLGPISPADQLMLLRTILPGEPDDVVERIAELSEGCPFVAEELAFVAVNRAGAEVPLSLRGAILERLGELDATARALLSRAAVFGRTVPFEDLLVLGAVDRPTMLAALRAARDRQILIEDDVRGRPVFRFRHALTREVLYSELLVLERADIHRAIADFIDAGDASERVAELAYHRWASGDRPAALVTCEAAGDEAQRLGAHGEARRNFARALECASDDAGYARLAGKVLSALRDSENFGAIRPICEAASLRLRGGAEDERGLLLCITGANVLAANYRAREASEMFDDLVGERGRDGSLAVRFERAASLLLIHVVCVRYEPARRVLEDARAVYESPTPAQEARLLRLHLLAYEIGKYDVAHHISIANLAVERARESGDYRLEANCLMSLAHLLGRQHVSAALPALEAAVALCEARRDSAMAQRLRANIASMLMDSGRLGEAIRLLDEATGTGSVGPQWIGSQTAAVRFLGRDPAPFLRAMRDPDRFIPSAWVALVLCSNIAYAVPLAEAQRLIAVAWRLAGEHPAGMFAVCVARFGDAAQFAAVCESMSGYEPGGVLSRGNLKLFEAYAARRQHRPLASKAAAIEAAAIFAECGSFRGRVEALELAGEIAAAVEMLRTAGAIAELARLEGSGAGAAPEEPIAALSQRERQIARIFSAGATSRETGDQLGIGARTVETHIAKIYQKLGVRTRGDLAALLGREAREDPA